MNTSAIRASIGITLVVFLSRAGLSKEPTFRPFCNPPLASGNVNEGNFDFGDHLFKRNEYQLAAKAYYQLFYCGRTTELNPHVADDPKIYTTFRDALALAVSGDFISAASSMKAIKQELPPFTEAGYLAGIFAWAAGNRDDARRAWQSTITGTRFAAPDNSADIAQAAAERMLKWSFKLEN